MNQGEMKQASLMQTAMNQDSIRYVARSAQTDDERGFTLIEVLMALTVFALIAGLAYTALGTAGNGFEVLHAVRLKQEKSGWVAKAVRSDLRYLTAATRKQGTPAGQASQADSMVPIKIHNDNRGDVEFDQLWLLVREPGLPTISQVHYFIDESNSHLIRESRSLLARQQVEPIRWDFGKISSWSVEVWDRQGNWRQDWNFKAAAFVWPKAVRVTLKSGADDATVQRQWWVPVLLGNDL